MTPDRMREIFREHAEEMRRIATRLDQDITPELLAEQRDAGDFYYETLAPTLAALAEVQEAASLLAATTARYLQNCKGRWEHFVEVKK